MIFIKKFRVRRWWGCIVEGVVFVSSKGSIMGAMGGRGVGSIVGLRFRRMGNGFVGVVEITPIGIIFVREGGIFLGTLRLGGRSGGLRSLGTMKRVFQNGNGLLTGGGGIRLGGGGCNGDIVATPRSAIR